MKNIGKRVKAIGSLNGMNQVVRLISNLGGVVIGVGNLEVDFLDGQQCRTIRFKEEKTGALLWREIRGKTANRKNLKTAPHYIFYAARNGSSC